MRDYSAEENRRLSPSEFVKEANGWLKEIDADLGVMDEAERKEYMHSMKNVITNMKCLVAMISARLEVKA